MKNRWCLPACLALLLMGCGGEKPLDPVKPGGKTVPETPENPDTPDTPAADPTTAGKGDVVPAWEEAWQDIH